MNTIKAIKDVVSEFITEHKELTSHPLKWLKSGVLIASLTLYCTVVNMLFCNYSTNSVIAFLLVALVNAAILFRQSYLHKKIVLTRQEELEVARIVTSSHFGMRLFFDVIVYMILAVLLILAAEWLGVSQYAVIGIMTMWSIIFVLYSYLIKEDFDN